MTEQYPIEEVAGKTLTEAQRDRLNALDWFIDELGIVMQENKEYGILQAQWRHTDRFNQWLYEGVKHEDNKKND